MNICCNRRPRISGLILLTLIVSGCGNSNNARRVHGIVGEGRDVKPVLVSEEPLPDPEMCMYEKPVSLRYTSLDVALAQQEFAADGQEVRDSETDRDRSRFDKTIGSFSDRKPIRMIRDPYSAFSAVGVDPIHNEVIVTDENLFNLLVYSRTENTGPKQITMPVRKIGGLNTQIEFQCSIYVDPKTGDIYSVNNDTEDHLTIFSSEAVGDAMPDRTIHTPHGTFGIAVDDEHHELMLSVQHDDAVVTFRKNASPEESPIRLLQGDNTLLADPHGITYDTKDDLLFVTNHGSLHQVRSPDASSAGRVRAHGQVDKQNWPLSRDDAVLGSGRNVPPSITVYARSASGDVPPVRVISGPKTQLDWPTGLAYDPRRDEIFVGNDMGNSVLVFPATADGDVSPVRVLKGRKSLIKNPTGVYFDSSNDELWVANFGNHTLTAFRPDASGDIPPLRVIRSAPEGQATPESGNPFAVAYDTKRQQILVPNCVAHPQIAAFARLANHNASPVRKVEGQRTLLGRTMHSIVYDSIHDEFFVPQMLAEGILTFRGDADGEEAPLRYIQGHLTQLQDPDHLDVDPIHNEIFVPQEGRILVFPRDATGNVAPIRVLTGPETQMGGGDLEVAVDPGHNLLVVGVENRTLGARILIFNRTDQGNVKPKAVIGGPNSGLSTRGIGGPFALYPPKGEIVMSLDGRGSEKSGSPVMATEDSYVGVWSINDDGDVPPRWTIGGPEGIFRMVRGVALDPAHKTIMVTDKRLNAIMTFYFPEMF